MSTISEMGETLLTLSFLSGVGPKTLIKLADHPRFPETDLVDVGKLVPGLKNRLNDDALSRAAEQAGANISQARHDGARIVTVVDADYPVALNGTPDRPAILFVKGTLQPERTVAVIGTREPTDHGAEITRRATRYLVEDGWSIVSGLALGTDGLAHQTALEAGGHTVAVLAHGLQTIAPRGHARLAQAILEQGGALVSEYPYGTAVFPAQFVKRDRTQAGLSQGVLMVQSDVQGGSLHASRAALDYRRPLAVPVPTPRDLNNREPKVQGNLVILNGGRDAAALLKCHEGDLDNVIPLASREDYPRFTQAMERPSDAPQPRLL